MLNYAIVMMVLKTSNMKSPDHMLTDENITTRVSACPNHFARLQTTSRDVINEDVDGRADERNVQLQLETNKPGLSDQHARFSSSLPSHFRQSNEYISSWSIIAMSLEKTETFR